MKTDKLAAVLAADMLRPSTPTPSTSIDCFGCGRSFVYRGANGDDSARFCSDRCREAFDTGFRAREVDPFQITRWHIVAGDNPGYLPSTPVRRGATGWHIRCAGCGSEFQSQGLRSCSSGCERRYRERQESAELMAEVGMDAPDKRICEKPGCKNPIPKWRNGRRVSERARYCDHHTAGLRKNGLRNGELDRKKPPEAAE